MVDNQRKHEEELKREEEKGETPNLFYHEEDEVSHDSFEEMKEAEQK